MSIDERLRTGLARNTEHLVPDLDRDLTATVGRARRRQRVRRGVVALTAAAAVAAATWIVDGARLGDDAVPVNPPPTPGVPTDLVGVTGPLEPGSYSLAGFGEKEGQPLPRAILEIPAGYYSNGGWIIDTDRDEPTEKGVLDELGVVQVWRVEDVLSTPCRARTAGPVGPTVGDLARALARQPFPSTKPIPTELDGHQGLYLEITVPPEADLDACRPHGDYVLWRAGRNSGPWHSARPGIVDHLWILDVDGTRLVTVMTNNPDHPGTDHQELIEIAESIHFEAPGS